MQQVSRAFSLKTLKTAPMRAVRRLEIGGVGVKPEQRAGRHADHFLRLYHYKRAHRLLTQQLNKEY